LEMSGESEHSRSPSVWKLTWIRFSKNRMALAGLIYIAASIAMAGLGYLICPDSTPLANDQKLSLSIRDPGFRVPVIFIRKNQWLPEKNPVSKMLGGEESKFE